MSKFLVTGALGFIGSYFVKYVLNNIDDALVVGVNRNSDQKNLKRLENISENPRFKMIYCDIAKDDVTELFEDIDYVVNFAAKTFVDHSIRTPEPFIQSNIIGTFRLLEEARKYKNLQRFLQISTDEIYGSILHGSFKENAPLNPTNPYSAAKASADMLAVSYYNTYNLPIIITRTVNNYGPFQHIQKAIPTFINKSLNNQPIPIYGDGKHKRMWIHVEDHCRAILHLLEHGKDGNIYHISSEEELENLELAKWILRYMGKDENNIEFINDFDARPGHDRRYALDIEKIKNLGWKSKYSFDEGFKKTVDWYLQNLWWLI